MNCIGVDLSKNHYGLCHIKPDSKIEFVYSFFKPYTIKESKEHYERYFCENDELISKDGSITLTKRRVHYNEKNFNVIQNDCLKSNLNVEHLTSFLIGIDGKKFISLEDYVTSGTKIVQLVHTGESFKYKLTEGIIPPGVVLFICPVVTWRKYLITVDRKQSKDVYELIKISLKNNKPELYNFIEGNDLHNDLKKELYDSYGLANTGLFYNDIFQNLYSKRIFIF